MERNGNRPTAKKAAISLGVSRKVVISFVLIEPSPGSKGRGIFFDFTENTYMRIY